MWYTLLKRYSIDGLLVVELPSSVGLPKGPTSWSKWVPLEFKWVPLNFFLINLFELQLFNIHSHSPFIVTICYCYYLT